MANQTGTPMKLTRVGMPSQDRIVPVITLVPAPGGPVVAHYVSRNCGNVTDILPIPAPPCVRTGAC